MTRLCSRARVPLLRVGPAVSGVVQRFGSASIAGAHIGAVRDEGLGELRLAATRIGRLARPRDEPNRRWTSPPSWEAIALKSSKSARSSDPSLEPRCDATRDRLPDRGSVDQVRASPDSPRAGACPTSAAGRR